MNYWQIILDEVAHYEDKGYRCLYSNLQETDIYIEKHEEDCVQKKPRKPKITYSLPGQYAHLHLSEREAECIYCLQRNHTIKSTAILLNLSARTVEFYLKNIKTKMRLRTKSEVLLQLSELDFSSFPALHETLADLINLCQPVPQFQQVSQGHKKNIIH